MGAAVLAYIVVSVGVGAHRLYQRLIQMKEE
jgi:hypothetical protein